MRNDACAFYNYVNFLMRAFPGHHTRKRIQTELGRLPELKRQSCNCGENKATRVLRIMWQKGKKRWSGR